jgi:tetratricopeptide (TPR) repeat protein
MMADVFAIQDDVAGSITAALELQLAPTADRSTANPEAYALYLQALALTGTSDSDEIYLAKDLVDQAISLDPGFARAYELKAIFHWTASGWLEESRIAQASAYEAAMMALALDPTLPGARSFATTAKPDWNWVDEVEALEEYLRAEPDNVVPLASLAYELVTGGYFEEAAQYAQRLIEVDPLAPIGYVRMAEALFAQGQREEARLYLERVLEREEDVVAMWSLGVDSLLEGDDETGIGWLEKVALVFDNPPEDVRPLVEDSRIPETGIETLNRWVETKVANASNLDERRQPYFQYLALGFLDEYWLGIEVLAGDESGWSDADTLEHDGLVFRRTGFAQHPKYMPRQIATSVTTLWDARGAPDHCEKIDDAWVCE